MWTPRRVLLLILGVAVFGMAFGIYSRFLGGIDGLPQLPGELLDRRADNDPFAPPTQTATQRKLLLAFGPNCEELAYSFMIELPAKGIVIAYNQHEFEPDGRIRLSPFSLATLKERTPGSFPEINSIHCDIGYLEFDKPVKTFQEIGSRRIVACELVGDPATLSHDPRRGSIHLVNNRGTAVPDDDLVLVTSGPVSYRESSEPGLPLDKARPEIWTKAAVQIVDKRNQPQSTSVTAQGMQVFLAVDAPSAEAKKRAPVKRGLAINGVRRVVMPENVNMNLWMESGGGFLASQQAKLANAAAAERTNLQISTLGPFTYDVLPEGDRARFDRLPPAATPLANCVRVVRPQKRAPDAVLNDQLESDHMELQFSPKPAPPIAAINTGKPANAPRNRTDPDRATIDWVHAWGQFVVLTSDEERLEARGTDLFHDVAAKKTTLHGNPDTIALKDGNEIHAPELVLYAADAKQSQHAEARGAGFVRLLDRSGTKRTVHARWRDRLNYGKENGQDLLVLTGDAMFEDTTSGQMLRGDTLKLLLAPDPRAAGAKPAPNAPSPRPRPQRVEAFGHVSARSAELVMHDTEELVLLFKDVVPGPIAPSSASPLPIASGPTGTPPARNVNEAVSNPAPPRKPIDIRARRIQAFVSVGPGDVSQIDNVHCEDNVHVHQDPLPPQTKPIDLDGQSLNLRHTPEGNVLEVTGTLQAPGEVTLPELALLGPYIKIDQIENVAEVIGIGSMKIESQTDLQGKKLVKPTPLTVTWKQKMRFNGQVALFHGHVQADQDATSLLCNNMQVFLNRPVSLNPQSGAGRAPDQSAANVDKVICDNQGQALPQNVSVTESIYADGKLLRYQRIETNVVALHKEEGTMEAGPGSVRILQPGPKDSANQIAAGKPGVKPVANQKAEEEYKLTWVRYGQTLRVDNPKRTASFYKNVEVLHLPKDDPGLQLEFSKIVDKLPQGAVYLRCEKLIVFSSKDAAGRTSQEFTANGRAEVQAAEFSGRADVIKFNEAKNLVIFEGSEGSLAELNRIVVRGHEPDTIKAEKIIYNRLTGEFDTKGTRITTIGGKR